MVEFMLVIVFIFVLFVSLVQVIMLMYAYNTLADAAKEGVRYAIVHGTGNTNCSGPGIAGQVTCPDAVWPYIRPASGSNVQKPKTRIPSTLTYFR